ncbi:hypothetical protein C0993_007894 [Termitomyces sp. T159_Od127]|nr:hypothetical protein C0993_007894 [Termitomyces sp. T159_Od127]
MAPVLDVTLLALHSNGFGLQAQPRSANPSVSQYAQSSVYIESSYPSYTPSSYTTSGPPRTLFTGFQGPHQSLELGRPGGNDNAVIYSALPPMFSEIPNHQAPIPAPLGRGAWNGPRTKNPNQGVGTSIPSDTFDWSSLSANSQSIGYDSTWKDSPSSTSSIDTGVECSYSLEVLSVTPPKPRSAAAFPLRLSTSSPSPPESPRASTDSPAPSGKSCSHCHATSTPLWRREPNTHKPLCNACGLYLAQRNKHRPQELIDADAANESDTSDGGGSGPECSHCHTHQTSVWRRSKTGAQLCNACGVYSRLRGKDRPLSLKRNKIKPRSKHTPSTPTTIL